MTNIFQIHKAHKLFIFSVLYWLFVYSSTLLEMFNVWFSSETYKHCLFILPIVLFLIYEKKEEISNIPFTFNWFFLVLLFIGQIVYLLADLSGINLISQLAAYGTIICLVGAVYGWQLFKFLIFPLCYLVLAIPMGEELVPLLQEVTADISVYLVQLVGIPVYSEGLYIYIPNGTFEVAEACAGIRFLIAMFAMGVLYAYMYYQSIKRRIVFIAISIILPILANGVRAFGIIYIGHVSDMEHATGADHLVYGWFFFALVLMLLIVIGRFWQEEFTAPKFNNAAKISKDYSINVVIIFVLITSLSLKPLYNKFMVGQHQLQTQVDNLHHKIKKQSKGNTTPSFGALFPTANSQYSAYIEAKNIKIELFSAEFLSDNNEQELINWANSFYDIDKMSLIDQKSITFTLNSKKISAQLLLLTTIQGKRKKLLYWYEVNTVNANSKLEIKMAQLKDKLAGGSGGGYAIATFYDDNYSISDVENTINLFYNSVVE